jgi:hypothetical protein
VVLFALLHRALDAGGGSLGLARQRFAAPGALGAADAINQWKRIDTTDETASEENSSSGLLPLRAAVLSSGDRLVALNRPAAEDVPAMLSTTTVEELFEGLDHRIIEDVVEDESSLASEIWRTFLFLMATALVLEALLSMPAKRPPAPAEKGASPAKSAA